MTSPLGDKEPQVDTWGDLTIKDTTQLNYCNTYSTTPTTPKVYQQESGKEKTAYSKPSEVDGSSYDTEMAPV